MEHDSQMLSVWMSQVGPGRLLDGLASSCAGAAVFIVDAERRIIYWSAEAAELLGYKADEVLGEHCLKANRCNSCIASCALTDRGHDAVDAAPVTLFSKAGERVSVLKSARAFLDPSGAFLGGVEVLSTAASGHLSLASDTQPSAALSASAAPSVDADHTESVPPHDFHGLLSHAPAMREVFDVARSVGRSDVTVLVRGESGTGKELLARAIHAESHRRDGPMVTVNCAAMAPSMLESELFGHEKGAFTGAVAQHHGIFERADGGTLFLDEVGELPLELQAKLLRVLEGRTFTRVGGSKELKTDVRIISATHRALRREVDAGRFRQDLMFRLRVVPLFLPPLRERRADIGLLLRTFIERHNRLGGRHISNVAPDAMRRLLDHAWFGNVREMVNVVEYAFAVGHGAVLAMKDLPPEFREPVGVPAAFGSDGRQDGRSPGGIKEPEPAQRPADMARPPSVLDEEVKALAWALGQTQGHVGRAAALLNMSRATFWRRRKKWGLNEPK